MFSLRKFGTMPWKYFVIPIFCFITLICSEPCPPPDIPSFGTYQPKKNTFLPGDKIVYTCDDGYGINGNDMQLVRTCNSNGHWSDQTPFCDKRARLDVPVGNLFDVNLGRMIDNITSTCSQWDQYRTHTFTLHKDYNWFQRKIIVKIYIESGTAKFQISFKDTFHEKAVSCPDIHKTIVRSQWVSTECVSGPVPDNIMITNTGGSGSISVCEVQAYLFDSDVCNQPPDLRIPNGFFRISRGSAYLYCADGFNPVNRRISCVNNVWSGNGPRCDEILCQPRVLNSTLHPGTQWMILDSVRKLSVGTRSQLICSPGYQKVGGPEKVTCLQSGRWTVTSATCKETLCQPHVHNAPLDPGTEWIYLDSVRKLSPGTRRQLKCSSGYQKVGGPVEVTCQKNGTWTKTNATCIEILCQTHEHNSTLDPGTEWMILDSVRKLSPGTKRRLNCSPGYQKVGDPEEITCQKNGTWTKTNATCIENLCQPHVHNSTLDPGTEWIYLDSERKLSPGARRQLKCSSGYQKVGEPEEVTCQKNGTWTETNATCTETLCQPYVYSSILDPGTEWIHSDSISKLSPGTRLILKCSPGYQEMGGPEEVTCQNNGTWTKTNATCIENLCQPHVHNSNLDPGTEWIFLDSERKLSPGTRRQLKCSTGYQEVGGPQEVICQKNGTWTETNATCIEVSAKTKRNLLKYLFEDQDYDKRFRPVKNQKTAVPVTVGLTPLEVKYKMQQNFPWKLDTWLAVKWKDEYLTWSPRDFGNIEQLTLPASKVWIPDLSLYHNNLDSSFLSDVTTNVIVRFDGELKWVTLNSVVIQYDETSSNCTISIKARTYDVSLMKINAEHQGNKSLAHFKNHSWKLKSIDVSEELGNFSWSDQPFSIMHFNLKFEKR